MRYASEIAVTEILSKKEILNPSRNWKFNFPKTIYDLGSFLKNYKEKPSPYAGKYVFIR